MKLSTRIALAVGFGVPLLVLAGGWLTYLLIAHDLHAAQDAHLRERAQRVSRDARRLLRVTADGKPAVAQQRQRQMFTAALDVGIRVRGPSGTVAGGPQPSGGTRLPRTGVRLVTVQDTDRPQHGDANSWRVLSQPVKGPHPGVHGRLWLFSADTASQAQLASVRDRILSVAVLAAPVSALLAWSTASRAARPLRKLQRRAGHLDPARKTARLEHTRTGINEVDDLAATLTTVLTRYDEQVARTEAALETARSFASAAGHELRTPMMSMRTNLDILAEHPDLDAAELHEVSEELRHEHQRLLGLLVMLQELGRGDLVDTDAMTTVDLADVAEAALAEARRRTPKANLTLSSHGTPTTVQGWEPGLRTLVDNLLVNACTHGCTSPHTPPAVHTSLYVTGAELLLRVDDQGPGIPHEMRSRVLERFERGPESAGSGLGLTLVAQQAAVHGADVRVEDGPGGVGTRIEVCFPPHDGAPPRATASPGAWLRAPTQSAEVTGSADAANAPCDGER